MASTKQQINLYWVSSADHDQDWFIFAASARSARTYHEEYEGYSRGDASSRLLVSVVTLKEFINGTPPCHARFEDLFQIGFQNAGATQNGRGGKFSGEIFRDGILEAIIELGRQQVALDNGGGRHEATSSSPKKQVDVPAVKPGPRLVN